MEESCDEMERKRKCVDNISSPNLSTLSKTESAVSNGMTVGDYLTLKKPRCPEQRDDVTVAGSFTQSSEEIVLHGVELNPEVVELVNVTHEEEEEANKSLNDLLAAIDPHLVTTSRPTGSPSSAQLVMVCDPNTGGVMTVYGLDSECFSSGSQNGFLVSRAAEGGGSSLGASRTHLAEHSGEVRIPNPCEKDKYTFPCHDCGKTFTSQRGRLIHSRLFHYKSRDVQEAEESEKSRLEKMSSMVSDAESALSMLQSSPDGWTQPLFGPSKQFPVASSLKHPDEQNVLKVFACSQCDSVYFSEKSRIMHERSAHGRGRKGSGLTKSSQDESSWDPAQGPFRCSKCSLQFPSALEHQLHFKRAHVQINRYLCNVCGERFQFRHDLRLHRESAHYQASAEEHCTCSETRGPALDATPVETSSQSAQKTFACNHCSWTFDKVEHLKSHLHAEHYSAEMPFSCKVCDTKFVNSSRLNEHMRLKHTNVKRLQCPCCDKKFRNAWVLKTHLSSESSHRCPKCNKKYKSALDILKQL